MGLVAKVGAGSASDAEVGRFQTLMQERAERILATPPEELFVARDVVAEPPPKPWISPPVHCAGCGEPVAAAHIRTLGERRLRIPCAQEADRAREAIRERLAMAARAVRRGPGAPGEAACCSGPVEVDCGGRAYGLDMTDEMLDLARRNAAEAGVDNVEFLKGDIEDVPLPDASVDVVISNCVINLTLDKPAVFAEMLRVLRPGGRIGVSDVVAEDRLSGAERATLGDWSSCIAGALSVQEYEAGLLAAGFVDVSVAFTHESPTACTGRSSEHPSPWRHRRRQELGRPVDNPRLSLDRPRGQGGHGGGPGCRVRPHCAHPNGFPFPYAETANIGLAVLTPSPPVKLDSRGLGQKDESVVVDERCQIRGDSCTSPPMREEKARLGGQP